MIDGVRVALIAAVAENGVIGDGPVIPWRLSTDMKRFKALTLGKPMILGRKTFETFPKPLPGRPHLVVSRSSPAVPEGVSVFERVDDALASGARLAADLDEPEIMVIGGGAIYAESIAAADRLYITHVVANSPGDVHFPEIRSGEWEVVSEESVPTGPRDQYASTFAIYQRRGQGRH